MFPLWKNVKKNKTLQNPFSHCECLTQSSTCSLYHTAAISVNYTSHSALHQDQLSQ